MFVTFFLRSLVLLKKYGKMFSLYSFLIIISMCLGFITRAIIYNEALVEYGTQMFSYLSVRNSEQRQAFVSFQQSMLVTSMINWVLNMVYDIIVLKMYSVYSAF